MDSYHWALDAEDMLRTQHATITTLRQIVSDSLAALGTSAGCTPDASLEFMRLAPAEIQDTITALREALAAPVVAEWQSIETAPKGRVVLVHYKNELGNGRTMRARYYTYETLESDNTESGWADEGWYEESEAYEYLMALEHEPTHWMPLPAAPKPKEQT